MMLPSIMLVDLLADIDVGCTGEQGSIPTSVVYTATTKPSACVEVLLPPPRVPLIPLSSWQQKSVSAARLTWFQLQNTHKQTTMEGAPGPYRVFNPRLNQSH